MWITVADVEAALGSTVPAGTLDAEYLEAATAAADGWAQRRRRTAGYVDDPDTTTPDVKLGTTLYAVALYRERGSVDSYASFEDLAAGFAPAGTSTQVNRLLGIGKPQVDRVPPDVVVP